MVPHTDPVIYFDVMIYYDNIYSHKIRLSSYVLRDCFECLCKKPKNNTTRTLKKTLNKSSISAQTTLNIPQPSTILNPFTSPKPDSIVQQFQSIKRSLKLYFLILNQQKANVINNLFIVSI